MAGCRAAGNVMATQNQKTRLKALSSRVWAKHTARVIASTDYMKLFAEHDRQWVPGTIHRSWVTDGFGRQRQPVANCRHFL